MNLHVIRLEPEDNVVIARHPLEKGLYLEDEDITVLEEIPAGYKCAARDIKKGEEIRKYNTVIGYASCDIKKGEVIHNHNDEFDARGVDYAFGADCHPVELLPPEQRRTFMGIRRADGRVGTRNYIGVLVCSNCAATVARKITEYFNEERMKAYPNVDGVVPFITELGCGMEQSGEPLALLQRTIAGYIRNPNMGGAILLSLGCERNNIDKLMDAQQLTESDRLKRMVIQEVGGTKASIELGIRLVEEMLPLVNDVKREPCSAEHLLVALECGGSDGFSGLSANPALGKAMDILVRNGGGCIHSETTEIFGAEHILTRRAVSPEVGQKLVDRLAWWLKHTEGRDCQINGKVSPGNNKGGLTNVLEKSLGGVKKSGTTPLNEVYEYAYPVTTPGVCFMDTPGYDPVASTGQIAGGANLLCFTTGRGSCFGSCLTPVIKLASNTPLYEHMEGDMDINCGVVIDGKLDIAQMGEIIFEELLKVASGEKTKSEELGVGESEYAPWPIGVFA
ncbi:UxaA family hydrolase [Dysosmobacter sp.]|uniref:UxaA family hydrolase n=1 Tax=Dysosmobacter sp. TaxID=2591382 RepID=UPI002A849CAD|nr:UxaA family hydrolase [Dysosmobacter sp.]MDY3282780.1 UxaA family hydrolase [Dysosmobacter sp.]